MNTDQILILVFVVIDILVLMQLRANYRQQERLVKEAQDRADARQVSFNFTYERGFADGKEFGKASK